MEEVAASVAAPITALVASYSCSCSSVSVSAVVSSSPRTDSYLLRKHIPVSCPPYMTYGYDFRSWLSVKFLISTVFLPSGLTSCLTSGVTSGVTSGETSGLTSDLTSGNLLHQFWSELSFLVFPLHFRYYSCWLPSGTTSGCTSGTILSVALLVLLLVLLLVALLVLLQLHF